MRTQKNYEIVSKLTAIFLSLLSPIIGLACLVFLIVALWRVMGARKDLYVAKNVQNECGNEYALEMDTTRYLMYKSFNLRPKTHYISVVWSFICALIVMVGVAFYLFWIRSSLTKNILDDINFWILIVMIPLMGLVYKYTENVLKTTSFENDVRIEYLKLQKNIPVTSNLDFFPKSFVDALVRRWYAVHPDERRKPNEIRTDVFTYMLNRHNIVRNNLGPGELSEAFYEFIGYVHPATDYKLKR